MQAWQAASVYTSIVLSISTTSRARRSGASRPAAPQPAPALPRARPAAGRERALFAALLLLTHPLPSPTPPAGLAIE